MSARWLFSAKVDLSVFLGSAVLAFLLLGIGAATGAVSQGTPDWAWVPAVLLVDVAHVWATGFRVYFDRVELARRPVLHTLVPVLGLAAGIALYSLGEHVFWRTLAYLAIFHFVRQQYGWVALYRAKGGEKDRAGRWLDAGAIYAATLYPLVWWHTHLPRRFDWFVPGDIAAAPTWVDRVGRPLYAAILGAYVLRSALGWIRDGRGNVGKDIVVGTTAACWYVGIVAINSDYAFTVTNVFIHGIPYFALVYYTRRPAKGPEGTPLERALRFLSVLWLIAFVEEMLWDRVVWQERGWLFGAAWDLGNLRRFLVPLLALPQITHYVLDGFVWRRRTNPDVVRAVLGDQPASQTTTSATAAGSACT